MKKRIIAMLLCLSMLLPMFTGSVVASGEDYSANVGRYAELADTGYGFQVGNFTDIATGNDVFLSYEEFEPGTIFRITDWYLDSASSGIWYEVEIYSGGVVPESQEYWPSMPWMLQNYLGEGEENNSLIFLDTCDICGKPDCEEDHEPAGDTTTKIYLNGEEVSQVVMPQFDKPTLSAGTTLSSEVSCRWQILADRDEELWVNIYGENSPELTLSYGMVATLLDSNNQAWVRCITTANGAESVSDALLITVEPYVASASVEETSVSAATEHTEETTAPTEEPTEPAEQTTEPAEEPTEATEETTEPGEETTESTEETTAPVEETTAPTEETTVPAEAAMEPTEEVFAPSEPVEEAEQNQDAMLLAQEYRIPSSASAVPVDDTHDIIVIYTFRDENTIAAPDYTATVGHGDSFTTTVTFPIVPGYEPVVIIEGAEVQQNEYIFNIPSVTEDVVLEVKYRPALVSYNVYVYLQNVENDDYPNSAIMESGLAYTNSTDYAFDQQNALYPGFYQLPYDKPPIAADGSTTVEIRYDRLYYLMKFDLDGGYGVEPIYARYGMPIEVEPPLRAGYAFSGWVDKDNNTVAIPKTMPVNGGNFRATWSAMNANYKVSYWFINDDGTRSLIGTRVELGVAETLASGEDDLAGSVICGNETVHHHTDECYSCSQSEEKHTASCFDVVGNEPEADGRAVIASIVGGNDPEPGYVYVIKTSEGKMWPKLYFGGNYYTINGVGSGSTEATQAQVKQITEGAVLGTGAYKNLTVEKYKLNIGNTHKNINRICQVHTHGDECYYDTRYLEYVESATITKADGTTVTYATDKNIVIKGDGTATVDVYYRYKEYTLRFYYAATTGGRDTNGDQINDTNFSTIKIVGGTTYYFGSWGPDTSNDEDLLENMYWNYSNQWGQISALPSLNTNGQAKNYNHGAETFTHNGTAVTYHYISFNARYGDNISEMWPCAVFNSATRTDKNNANGWSGKEAFVSAWNGEDHVKYSRDNSNETIKGLYERLDENLLFHSDFADERTVSYLCFWENGANISWSVPELYRYNIYLEAYGGQDLTGKTTVTRGGKTYYLANSYDTCDNSSVDEQTQVSLTGYEKKGYTSSQITNFDTSLYKEAWNVNFFYDAYKYRLSFWNHSDYLTNGTGSMVMYGEPLEKYFEGTTVNGTVYDGANDLIAKQEYYPDTLEPNAYEFEGWYTSAQFQPETKVNPSTMKMPAEALMVYARWVPKLHNVRLFLTIDLKEEGTTHMKEFQIYHGQLVPEDQRPADPVNGNYQFIGWFYRDENGREMAFDFANMPIKDNMHLYAKWSSSVLVSYTVHYYEEGTTNPVAPDTTGSALAGNNKTFYAIDAPDEWFPTVKSHGLTLNLDETKNVYTFYYVKKDAVPYTVRYVTVIDGREVELSDASLGIVDAPVTKTYSDNKKAVVTEPFVPVPGYLPDASRKTLVVSADGKDNVITFYYTRDEVNGYYIVSDWLQDTDGTTWTQSIREEGTGKLGTRYERTPLTIPGFTYVENHKDNVSSGTLVKNEILRLNFHYTRNKYPYQIRYLELGTEKVLADPVTFKDDAAAYYGAAVNAEGKPIAVIDGYKLHSVAGCTIGIETNVDNLYQNVVKVYYVPVTGNLKLTKQIQIRDDAAPSPYNQVFEFQIAVPDGTYPVTIGENREQIQAEEGILTVNLKHGESALIENLPQGPSTDKHPYTITETYVPGFHSTFSPAGPYTVTEGQTTSVTCTNEYPVGNLVITKTVTKEYPGTTWNGDAFDFTITNPELPDGNSYKVTIGETEKTCLVTDHTITLEDIPVNDVDTAVTILVEHLPLGTYRVSEAATDAQKTDYGTTVEVETGTESEEDAKKSYAAVVPITVSDSPATVHFVNTVKRKTGSLYLEKELVAATGFNPAELPTDTKFSFSIQLMEDPPAGNTPIGLTYDPVGYTTGETAETSATMVNGVFSVTLQRDQNVTMTGLPEGKYRIIEETIPSYANAFAHMQNGEWVEQTVTPTEDGRMYTEIDVGPEEEPSVKCTNTYPVDKAELIIQKLVIKEYPWPDPVNFTFTVTLTEGEDDSYSYQVYHADGTQAENERTATVTNKSFVISLEAGQYAVIPNMPVCGYTVVETVDVNKFDTSYEIYVSETGESASTTVNTTEEADDNGLGATVEERTFSAGKTDALVFTNEYKYSSLTIERTNAEPDRVFVYEVKDASGNAITVTVTGNSSTTIHGLIPGPYTVTQKNDWSWRYKDEAKIVVLPVAGDKVTFGDNVENDSWLDGNSGVKKNLYGQAGE